MIIVCSAGNTGEYSWRVIWAPADGPHVITAGADRFTDKVFKASYSGRGNPDVSFVKPDVICYSPSGTSFTTPVITGMIACILQKDSTLSPALVRELLHRSSGLFPYPNNYVGYGVPDASRILRCLDNPGYEHGLVSIIRETGKSVTISTDSENIVVFEKSDDYIVKRQYTAKATTGTFSISRSSGVKRTTVALGLDEFFEIFWD
jgi:subtilisin family serine protease